MGKNKEKKGIIQGKRSSDLGKRAFVLVLVNIRIKFQVGLRPVLYKVMYFNHVWKLDAKFNLVCGVFLVMRWGFI